MKLFLQGPGVFSPTPPQQFQPAGTDQVRPPCLWKQAKSKHEYALDPLSHCPCSSIDLVVQPWIHLRLNTNTPQTKVQSLFSSFHLCHSTLTPFLGLSLLEYILVSTDEGIQSILFVPHAGGQDEEGMVWRVRSVAKSTLFLQRTWV